MRKVDAMEKLAVSEKSLMNGFFMSRGSHEKDGCVDFICPKGRIKLFSPAISPSAGVWGNQRR